MNIQAHTEEHQRREAEQRGEQPDAGADGRATRPDLDPVALGLQQLLEIAQQFGRQELTQHREISG
jgi:hypothetical protein